MKKRQLYLLKNVFFFQTRGTTGMICLRFCLSEPPSQWFCKLFIFLRFPTHKENITTDLHPLPRISKRNYKIKYKNILWNALCFSFAHHKHLCFNIRQVRTKLLVCSCVPLLLHCVLKAEALIYSCLYCQRPLGIRIGYVVNVGWICLLNFF